MYTVEDTKLYVYCRGYSKKKAFVYMYTVDDTKSRGY